MIANIQAERDVLFSMIYSAECCDQGLLMLSPSDFYHKDNTALFEAIKRCAAVTEVNNATILSYTDNVGYVTGLQWAPPAQFRSCVNAVKEAARRREAAVIARKAVTAAEANEQEYINLLQDALNAAQSNGTDVSPVGSKAIEAVNSLFEDRKNVQNSGFPSLDYYIRGLNSGELIVLAARPGMGKTSLAMNVAVNVAKTAPVAVFSLETSEKMLLRRAVYAMAGHGENDVLRRDDAAIIAVSEAASQIGEMPLYINDRSGITPEEITSACYAVKRAAGGLGLVVIDYLQLITGRSTKNGTREQVVSEISRKMKILSCDLNVPILLLSQLHRGVEQRTNKTPVLSDLRESGAIEQDADIVLFIGAADQDEEAQLQNRRVIIAKNRNGKTGAVGLLWRGEIFRFFSIENGR